MGAGKSGVSAARLLARQGADVILNDLADLAGMERLEGEGTGTARTASAGSFSDTSPIRVPGRRPARSPLATNQYSAPFGLPGACRGARGEGHSDVDPLRLMALEQSVDWHCSHL